MQFIKDPVINRAKEMNRHFSKANTRVINDHIERWSTSPFIKEVQTKPAEGTARHIPTRMAKIGKTHRSQDQVEYGANGTQSADGGNVK